MGLYLLKKYEAVEETKLVLLAYTARYMAPRAAQKFRVTIVFQSLIQKQSLVHLGLISGTECAAKIFMLNSQPFGPKGTEHLQYLAV